MRELWTRFADRTYSRLLVHDLAGKRGVWFRRRNGQRRGNGGGGVYVDRHRERIVDDHHERRHR